MALLLANPIAARAGETTWQYSTIAALSAGVYDGDVAVGELKKHGNLGLVELTPLNRTRDGLGKDVLPG